MSWVNRPPSAGPAPGPPGYVAPQQYANQQNMFPNYQMNTSANSLPPPQQYWHTQQQPQQPMFNQQYGQVYQQTDYPANNANQVYQYNQNYSNPSYSATQQTYPHNYYQGQQGQQNIGQTNQSADGWEEKWDWDVGDSLKQVQNVPQQQAPPALVGTLPTKYDNANVIEESFASTQNWKWAIDDKNDTKDSVPDTATVHGVPQPVAHSEHPMHSMDTSQRSQSNQSAQSRNDDVNTLNDKEIVKERLPNLAVGKRFHLENLTPQWSIESQMSQESSDGVQTHSESTYLSENQSRNSNSSPQLNVEQYNLHSGLEESSQNTDWTKHSIDEPSLSEKNQSHYALESHDDITNPMRDMNLESSSHISASIPNDDNGRSISEGFPRVSQRFPHMPPPLPASSVAASVPPPPAVIKSDLKAGPPPSVSLGLPPPISANSNIPTTSSASNQNPFKNPGAFSHKSSVKMSPAVPNNPFPPIPKDSAPPQNPNLMSPSAVNKVVHAKPPTGFSANLETTPDNSERPDQPQVSTLRPSQASPQMPENLEVAPRNDRNQYLQTAHLSSGDFGENTDFSQNVPPPGLRRMVVGQQDSEYGQNMKTSSDEPPPGLARMVPGQQTESDKSYSQSGDSYLDRHIDGQTMDTVGRPYRQAEGQQQSDAFSQPPGRGSRSLGMDRMVPGEPSNEEYTQYQNPNFVSNEQRVVTGVDRDYGTASSDVREQNMDGSDYTDHTLRNSRSVHRDSAPEVPINFNTVEDQQREVTMEGENLQDLSVQSSAELSYSREHNLIGADTTATDPGIKTDASDSLDITATSSRRQSLNRVSTSGEDSERIAYHSLSRRKTSKDKDNKDREKESKYPREDKKKERDSDRRSDRRSDKDRRDRDHDRRERDISPSDRRQRRSARSHRYETEDTDYYSDRERERRRYREGSYTSKPPRPDDKDRRYRDDRDRNRRYNTIERDRRYVDERDGTSRPRRSDRDRYDRQYRDIDPTRRHGNLRREREEEERRRVVTFSGDTKGIVKSKSEELSPGRAASRTDEEGGRRRTRRTQPREPYMDATAVAAAAAAAAADPYAQYRYYEQLRRTDPVGYAALYRRLMADPSAYYAHAGYAGGGAAERGSVLSGRSSANELTHAAETTDASMSLQLEESTVRSERLTPCKFSCVHAKGVVGSADVCVSTGAGARLVPLRSVLPSRAHYPGPFQRGVTHKKSVVEFCRARSAAALAGHGADPVGAALLWDLLALLLTQNGTVVGTDLAELLLGGARDSQHRPPFDTAESAGSASPRARLTPPPAGALGFPGVSRAEDVTPEAALDRFRDYLLLGDRHNALEWAMWSGQWAHALHLAALLGPRALSAAAARFSATLPASDPLCTLYGTLSATPPPLSAQVAGGEWRAHAAVLLANSDAEPDRVRRALLHIGDTLSSVGRPFSGQFCYVCAGLTFARHPLAPYQLVPASASNPAPRLTLLLAGAGPTLDEFATDDAIIATDIYEYAMSLSQDYIIEELQVYRVVLAVRLLDEGRAARALRLLASSARRLPGPLAPELRATLCELAHRLKYLESELDETEAEGLAWMLQLDQSDMASQAAAPEPGYHQQHSWKHEAEPTAEPPAETSTELQPEPVTFYQPPPTTYVDPWYPPAAETQAAPQEQQYWQPDTQYGQNDAAYGQSDASYAQNDTTYGQNDTYGQYDTTYGQSDSPYGQNDSPYGYNEEARRVTLPGAARDSAASSATTQQQDSEPEPPTAPKEEPRGKEGAAGGGGTAAKAGGGGWLGGILNKLSLRPPNQMILPDDTNPSIVWDAENKRWRSVDGEPAATPPPARPPPANIGAAGPGGNMFKMQKNRHIKKSYVDVLNPAPAAPPAQAPPPAMAPSDDWKQ